MAGFPRFFSLILCHALIIYAFPGVSVRKDEKALLPMYAPDRCPENQLLYPGATKQSDWVCDCGPGYVYYAPKDDCFAIYRRGPCPAGDHLIIKTRATQCVKNPCNDGFAKFKDNKCYELGQPNGPCGPVQDGGGIFDVNATTLTVGCLNATELLSLVTIPQNCALGTKRFNSTMCLEDWNI